MNEHKTIEVVAAIIRKGDAIFATQRGYGEWKDYWEAPGGKVEPGETARAGHMLTQRPQSVHKSQSVSILPG